MRTIDVALSLAPYCRGGVLLGTLGVRRDDWVAAITWALNEHTLTPDDVDHIERRRDGSVRLYLKEPNDGETSSAGTTGGEHPALLANWPVSA